MRAGRRIHSQRSFVSPAWAVNDPWQRFTFFQNGKTRRKRPSMHMLLWRLPLSGFLELMRVARLDESEVNLRRLFSRKGNLAWR